MIEQELKLDVMPDQEPPDMPMLNWWYIRFKEEGTVEIYEEDGMKTVVDMSDIFFSWKEVMEKVQVNEFFPHIVFVGKEAIMADTDFQRWLHEHEIYAVVSWQQPGARRIIEEIKDAIREWERNWPTPKKGDDR